jgi:Domain of unknown function (DUF4160)
MAVVAHLRLTLCNSCTILRRKEVGLSNSNLCIFADDHDPPHFHVLGQGWSGVIDLGTLTLRKGTIPKGDFLEAVSVGKGE